LKLYADGKLPNIVFSDEKLFTIEQAFNPQNDRVYLSTRQGANSERLQFQRAQGAASVMVWAAVTADGRSPLVFLPARVKINGAIYRESVLDAVLRPWSQQHFGTRRFTFQQDSAPAHKARQTQQWLRDHVPNFIPASEWPASSPDLNPLDFSVRANLEKKVCSTRHTSTESLKAALLREWDRLPQEDVRAACESFPDRLARVVRAKGGHIE
jgi:inhibitor of nuclear factor kappa-B kinase subunit alpha